ncbi:MAG TPA: alkyl sulfatase dimerization domain-containing protein [Chitinophaga sp.]|uniref:alkyl/aryl-sulfatase n=1 Tax=Chitinophaga sp. TaxID=1869181 RepID=UPI002B9EA792|nr:alkyl sulfatase dimerization domain-containing protein [Chitinophaga sp.]HVI48073.1 alkyl sulfatase dimerization domain-containing protein [Chitinophaga sp.]
MRKTLILILAGIMACSSTIAQGNRSHKPATVFTRNNNKMILQQLNFNTSQDSVNASNGLIRQWPDLLIGGGSNVPAWNMATFKFLKDATPYNAPATVNPSLWREAQLNYLPGVFKVADSIYQVRGFDLSNMTLIKGNSGWIVIDPLSSNETAKAAFDSINNVLNIDAVKRHISVVIFTHSHVDHYGGIDGIKPYFIADTKIYAPDGFLEHAINENTIAGNVMGRRASYMYGYLLPKDTTTLVDAGLGKGIPAGANSILSNNVSINQSILQPAIDTLDGVVTKFWITPGAEAPVEMMFYFPGLKALCASEEVTHTMHNVYSLRGTKVRDALGWSKFIDSTLAIYGDTAQVMFASHHWPVWGKKNIRKLLLVQRDMYRYIHDQTLRWANQGYTPLEMADSIRMPKSLDTIFANRGYYGTLNHNIKSVYDYYLGGWFDGNPANLHPLTPREAGRHYVEFMGGRDSVMSKAQRSFNKGEYRWVATVLNHLVFSNPADSMARFLLADTYEQLGYQSESAPWRNFYLTGAQELRFPEAIHKFPSILPSNEILNTMPLSQYFDFLAIHLVPDRIADGTTYLFRIILDSVPQKIYLSLENKTINYQILPPNSATLPQLNATISLPRNVMDTIIQYGPTAGAQAMHTAVNNNQASITGPNPGYWYKFISFLDKFNFWFNIVTP